MNKSFDEYAKYYDYLYKDKPYKKEAYYIKKFFLKKKLDILEIGCGSGSHAIEFEKLGHNVVALDSSSNMISLAKKKNNKVLFLVKDGKSFKSKKKFDIVILLFHVINFFHKKKEIKKFFENSNYNLKKNGLLIFDFINYEALRKFPPKKKVKTIKLNNKLTLIRKTIPNFNKITKIFKIKFKILLYKHKYIQDKFLEIHNLRIYNLSEYHKFYNKFFELKNIYSWMSFSQLKENHDWHGFMILKKK